LPSITCARDAADISAAVIAAVSDGLTLSEAAEIGKLIDCFVKAYQVAELNDRIATARQMSDGQLLHIANDDRDNAGQRAPKLLLLSPR
jgi:hypothetical protein